MTARRAAACCVGPDHRLVCMQPGVYLGWYYAGAHRATGVLSWVQDADKAMPLRGAGLARAVRCVVSRGIAYRRELVPAPEALPGAVPAARAAVVLRGGSC
ncbi:MAG: hypothetical protein RL375_2560 [Pseudomonadota bacterium]|jgi:hypothetical protein